MYVVTVLFEIEPNARERFMPLMLENARLSLEREPGCRQFDICADPERETEIFLYEVYDDHAAFDLHLQTEHFKSFDAAVSQMIAGKQVRYFIVAT